MPLVRRFENPLYFLCFGTYNSNLKWWFHHGFEHIKLIHTKPLSRSLSLPTNCTMPATQVELGFSWTFSDFTTWCTFFWRRKQKGKFGLLISEAVTNMFISLSLFGIECRRLCDNLSFDISAVAISLLHSIRTYEVMLRRDLEVAIRDFNMTIGSFNTLGLAFQTWGSWP